MSTLTEALRYMQAGDIQDTRQKAEQAIELLRRLSPPKYIYRVFSLEKEGDAFLLKGSGVVLRGKSAETMLRDCHHAALMICTLGFGFEAELRTRQARSMADTLVLDACGSALTEEGCDDAEREIASLMPGSFLTDRFSPGYGDLPLALQEDISRALNAEKLLGVHLNESLLFYPCKTVSAIIGIADEAQPARIRGCDSCSMREKCSIRKRGGSCGK